MKLYFSSGACSLAPHIVLRELGLAHTLVKVDTRKRQTANGDDYLKINGKGYVPALELDDGQVLTEAAVILQYLADRKPEAGLAPAAGTMERYRLQEWLNFIATEIHKGFGPLWKPDSTEDEKERTRNRLAARLDWLAARIQGREYVAGGQFGIADAYLFTVLNWGQWTSVDLAKWPALQAYHARIAARPKVQEALRAEGLLKSAQAAA
ncbi:MAG TPA: glutathione transferase GstA [Burkholderiales bacterium]|jgi:glutathione S-transferase|nr:glutathione transferase GstA [Burkholderiales bacterium]